MVKVNIKWGKEKFQDVELDTSGSVEAFKKQLCSMTGEQPDTRRLPGTLAPCRTNHLVSAPLHCYFCLHRRTRGPTEAHGEGGVEGDAQGRR